MRTRAPCLHYQGSTGHWVIAIYKDSTDQYTGAELPGSPGRPQALQEQGIDDTLIRYTDPRTGN